MNLSVFLIYHSRDNAACTLGACIARLTEQGRHLVYHWADKMMKEEEEVDLKN